MERGQIGYLEAQHPSWQQHSAGHWHLDCRQGCPGPDGARVSPSQDGVVGQMKVAWAPASQGQKSGFKCQVVCKTPPPAQRECSLPYP